MKENGLDPTAVRFDDQAVIRFFSRPAPVKASRSWPKSSLAISSGEKAPQLTHFDFAGLDRNFFEAAAGDVFRGTAKEMQQLEKLAEGEEGEHHAEGQRHEENRDQLDPQGFQDAADHAALEGHFLLGQIEHPLAEFADVFQQHRRGPVVCRDGVGVGDFFHAVPVDAHGVLKRRELGLTAQVPGPLPDVFPPPFQEKRASSRRSSISNRRQVLSQMTGASSSGASPRTSATFSRTVRTKAGSLRRWRLRSGVGVR